LVVGLCGHADPDDPNAGALLAATYFWIIILSQSVSPLKISVSVPSVIPGTTGVGLVFPQLVTIFTILLPLSVFIAALGIISVSVFLCVIIFTVTVMLS
jgi:hypothetical protein